MTLDGYITAWRREFFAVLWTLGALPEDPNTTSGSSSTLHTWRLNKDHPSGHFLLNHGLLWGCLILGPKGLRGRDYLKPPIKSFLRCNKRWLCCKILIRSSAKCRIPQFDNTPIRFLDSYWLYTHDHFHGQLSYSHENSARPRVGSTPVFDS